MSSIYKNSKASGFNKSSLSSFVSSGSNAGNNNGFSGYNLGYQIYYHITINLTGLTSGNTITIKNNISNILNFNNNGTQTFGTIYNNNQYYSLTSTNIPNGFSLVFSPSSNGIISINITINAFLIPNNIWSGTSSTSTTGTITVVNYPTYGEYPEIANYYGLEFIVSSTTKSSEILIQKNGTYNIPINFDNSSQYILKFNSDSPLAYTLSINNVVQSYTTNIFGNSIPQYTGNVTNNFNIIISFVLIPSALNVIFNALYPINSINHIPITSSNPVSVTDIDNGDTLLFTSDSQALKFNYNYSNGQSYNLSFNRLNNPIPDSLQFSPGNKGTINGNTLVSINYHTTN